VTSPAKEDLDVAVEVKELGGGEVELEVRVPPEPVVKIREQVLRTFGRRANIPGFRKGKAPRSILERYLDEDALKEQITDTLLEDAYEAAVEKADLKPLGRAQLGEAVFADDWAMTFSATVMRRPPIELGEYKGLKATRYVTPVTDRQVEAELERLRSRQAEYAELPAGAAVESGDLVIIDYDMLVDGEKREDASASGYPLEVGKDDLFPELNEALPGTKPGELREVEVTYPEEHSDESLRGKTVQFQVTVQQARRRQAPELNDELAKRIAGLDTLEALRTRLREHLEAVGRAMSEEDLHNQLVRQVTEAASLDVPQTLVDRETDRRIDDIEDELDRRGLTLHQHLQNTGRSFEDWRADVEMDARQAARRALVLDEIGEREDVQVSEEEMNEEIARIADIEEVSEEEVRERLSDSAELNRLVMRLYHRKIVKLLVDNAEIAEETVQPTEEEGEGGSGEGGGGGDAAASA
jgi:trigger factor